MDIDLIKMLWQTGDVEFTDEALDRMDGREVTLDNIGEAIMSGCLIEERPRSRPHAKCTVLGWAGKPKSGRVKCRTASAQCGVRSHRYDTNYHSPA